MAWSAFALNVWFIKKTKTRIGGKTRNSFTLPRDTLAFLSQESVRLPLDDTPSYDRTFACEFARRTVPLGVKYRNRSVHRRLHSRSSILSRCNRASAYQHVFPGDENHVHPWAASRFVNLPLASRWTRGSTSDQSRAFYASKENTV